MFDKLYMLAEGKNIYKGTVRGLVPFLASMGLECPSYHNPADFVMEIACGEYGSYVEMLANAVETGKCSNLNNGSPNVSARSCENSPAAEALKSVTNDIAKKLTEGEKAEAGENIPMVMVKASDGEVKVTMPEDDDKPVCLSKRASDAGGGSQGSDADPSSLLPKEGGSSESLDEHCQSFPTTTCTQFQVLFIRTFKSIIRDRTLTRLRMISHVAIGILIGLLYWDVGNEASKVHNNSAMLFFCMLFCMFTAMMPTVMTFPLEMNTFKREHLNYWYSMKSYYLAKVMADMPFQVKAAIACIRKDCNQFLTDFFPLPRLSIPSATC